MATLTFADGTTMERPATLSEDIIVRGKTHSGLLVVEHERMVYALTRCCHASGKGVERGLACRACYGEADWETADCGDHLIEIPLA